MDDIIQKVSDIWQCACGCRCLPNGAMHKGLALWPAAARDGASLTSRFLRSSVEFVASKIATCASSVQHSTTESQADGRQSTALHKHYNLSLGYKWWTISSTDALARPHVMVPDDKLVHNRCLTVAFQMLRLCPSTAPTACRVACHVHHHQAGHFQAYSDEHWVLDDTSCLLTSCVHAIQSTAAFEGKGACHL